MSVVYSVRITLDKEDEKKEKRSKEIEEFIHRYRDFMNPVTLATIDSVTLYEFKRQSREFLGDSNIDDYFKNMIRRMELNARSAEEIKTVIYEMEYDPLWYF